MKKYHFTCINNFNDFTKIKNDWNLLWKKTNKNIFLSYEWYNALLKSKIDCNIKLNFQIWVLYENNFPKCIAPLKIEENTINFLSNCEADYQDLIYNESTHCEVMLNFIKNKYLNYHFKLIDVPKTSKTVSVFNKIFPNATINISDICPYCYISKMSNIYTAGKNFKRKINKLSKLGDIKFEHITNGKDIKKNLPTMKKFFSQRWSSDPSSSFFFDKYDDVFMEEITKTLSDNNNVLLSILYLNNNPISYFYGFVIEEKYLFYRSAFSREYELYSPGMLTLHELLNFCSIHEIKIFDFMRGDYLYKKRYTATYTTNLLLEV